jgi:hypothetical protein
VSWDPPTSGTPGDLFAKTEETIRALVAGPWWRGAGPPQQAEAITAHMLAGAGEWWLFGAWGRWYRSGLDGSWHPCPAPDDPAARRVVGAAPRGAGRPPVPAALIPAGPDLAAGRVAGTGFVSGPPSGAVVARVQQALISALSVNPAQFALRDQAFAPGTPSTVAAAWGALLWCAGSPVAVADHPLIELFAPYLAVPSSELRWMTAPELARLAGFYCERLSAGDGAGAAHVVRVIAEIAAALRTDPAFRPGAHALDAIAAATTQMIQFDLGGIRFGARAVIDQWHRRCPPAFATAVMRETAPGDYLRLALYDLAEILRPRLGGTGATAERHAALALLAADLQAAPAARAAVLPWLDPDSARTLQAIAARPDHPLRRLWPRDGRLPDELRPGDGAGDPAAAELLATSYALGLTWCRLAQIAPPAPGLVVPAAAAAELPDGPGPRRPKGAAEMTAWQIIEAARAHLAAGRVPPPAAGQAETGAAEDTPAPEEEAPEPPPEPPEHGGAQVVEAYGIRFLCGLDDVELLLTELRRRGQWAQRLRGQEISSASTPGLLLVGAPSSGQRRVTRLVSRALAEVGSGSGEVRGLPADRLRERGPDGVRAALDEHAGHTVLLDGLDALILDDAAGAAFAAALYRARVEGVSQTTLVATCGPDRLGQLSAAHPELVTDLRVVRLPDLADPAARVALLELLAAERHLELSPAAWEVARRDLDRMRGRGRLAGARLIESYLDRAVTRHLGQTGDTHALNSDDDGGDLTLGPEAFDGVAEDLEPALRDLRDVDAYLAELRSLAGLAPVKDAVERIVAEARVAAARRRAGLPVADGQRHLGFAGNPGTGKTTVAHLVGKLFAAIGMLESGHLVECAPADLTGAEQAAAKADDARGGVLVVDRAPELAGTGEPDGAGAAELAGLMDGRRDELIVICTGGPDDLPAFLAAAPAVRERLGEVIVFPDPADADLIEIFRRCAAEQQYVLDDGLTAALPGRVAALRAEPGYAAGHSVRRLFDDVVARQSVRIGRPGAPLSAGQLTRLTTDDLP